MWLALSVASARVAGPPILVGERTDDQLRAASDVLAVAVMQEACALAMEPGIIGANVVDATLFGLFLEAPCAVTDATVKAKGGGVSWTAGRRRHSLARIA